MAIKISLTQGQTATVCDCHAYLVTGSNWCAMRRKDGTFYASRGASVGEKRMGMPSTIFMHSVINRTPKGFQTDHKDLDTLNNQCENLRTTTPTQNTMNQRVYANNKSGLKGVSWGKHERGWKAQIKSAKGVEVIGTYATPEDAARAYDAKAREIFGEFARTNF